MQKSLANKLIIVVVITIALLIPLSMIASKIQERASYLQEAKQSVSRSWTSSQRVLPALVILPYEVHQQVQTAVNGSIETKTQITKLKEYLVPTQLNVTAAINNSLRHKGIYQVPVYTTNIAVTGQFNSGSLHQLKTELENKHDKVVFKAPYFTTLVSDPRGIDNIPALSWNKGAVAFQPGSKLRPSLAGVHAPLPASLLQKSENNQPIPFSYQLALRGMETLSFVPSGLDNSFEASSNWPHPQFVGDFLPSGSDITAQGYKANWRINSFANNILDKADRCERGKCEALLNGSIGIKHIETVDVYLQSERSVKYGILFIGLCFVTFLLFELLAKLSIHPVQYGLVGLANAIFYLLLISLSENTAFSLAYLIASIACIGLIGFYVRPIINNRWLFSLFILLLSVLYSVLYIIINMEDLALLTGSLLTFIVLSLVMFSTRHIDWYQLGNGLKAQGSDEG